MAGPDHVGIVSDRTDSAGRPLIINNWDNGHKTTDMALLGRFQLLTIFGFPRGVADLGLA